MDTLVGMVPGGWTSCPLRTACDIQSGPSVSPGTPGEDVEAAGRRRR